MRDATVSERAESSRRGIALAVAGLALTAAALAPAAEPALQVSYSTDPYMTCDALQEESARMDAFLACAMKEECLRGLRVEDLVFGHTHQSLDGRLLTLPSGRTLRCWNTGCLTCQGESCDFKPVAVDGEGRVAVL